VSWRVGGIIIIVGQISHAKDWMEIVSIITGIGSESLYRYVCSMMKFTYLLCYKCKWYKSLVND